MSKIKKIEFKRHPAKVDRMDEWLDTNENRVEVLGTSIRPYRLKTKTGKYKLSNTEIVTIYYKEK